MNEIETVKSEVLPISDQAKMIVVNSLSTLAQANDFFLTIKALRKKIADTFDPIIKKAHEAHREALNQKALVEAPLVTAERYLNEQVTAYKRWVDVRRREEEERLRQEAIKAEMERRKQEEEQRLAEAAVLESAGAKEEAEALIAETLEENQKPVEVYVQAETPKVELEGATVKTYWQAEVTDLRALCRAIAEGKASLNCIEPNMTVLNQMARALRKELAIPGVKAVSTSSMASTGKRKAA